MKGIVLNRSLPGQLEEWNFDSFSIKENQVKIQIKAAALNHRDEWCRQGLYPNLKDGVILGSDGSGIVSELGSNVKHLALGQKVIVNPALNWGDNQKAQAKDFQIIGMPNHGTLAEELVVDSDRIYPRPDHLTWEEAAALPLAGLTAYRALCYQGQVKSGEKVLITGFGGGVAQFATQFALALGAEVYVSSSSAYKIEKAISLGVKAGFNYQNADWTEEANSKVGGFDLMIDGAAGDPLNDLIKVASPGARIVFYGATRGNPGKLEARKIFWNQLKIMGSTMGSDQDFEEMLDLVNRDKIKPIVDQVFSFDQAVQAFDKMKAGDQMGKIVLRP
ncbi:quinone oxidoreductase family protein [Algoriphagus hitonicola]|uniref:NADPH:quinone reductase n=1 Tax=Algoriphagus hitonicola TaxID=435880 RepID=A0A1I2RSY8_9BACT|nr:zinc-binding dehydrogenase [Algoriphagus hitonicola]SFG40866.1 NADPH:quinone reductase [Algoriphagus hitonicola]